MRLFIAAEIPADAQAAVWQAVEPLREVFPRIRWVPPENLHVTLKFLGEIREDHLDLLEERLASIASRHDPFELGFEGVGGFPSGKRAKTIWLGLDDPAGSLPTLAAEIVDDLTPDFDPDGRVYHPHLTVARATRPVALLDTLVPVNPPEPVVCACIGLFRSRLSPEGPTYTRIAHAALPPPVA